VAQGLGHVAPLVVARLVAQSQSGSPTQRP